MAAQVDTHALVDSANYFTIVNTYLISGIGVLGLALSWFFRRWMNDVEGKHTSALQLIEANRKEREAGQNNIIEQIAAKTRDRMAQNDALRELIEEGRREIQREQRATHEDVHKICERLSGIESWESTHDKLDDERNANLIERIVLLDAIANASKNAIMDAREAYHQRVEARKIADENRSERQHRRQEYRDEHSSASEKRERDRHERERE